MQPLTEKHRQDNLTRMLDMLQKAVVAEARQRAAMFKTPTRITDQPVKKQGGAS